MAAKAGSGFLVPVFETWKKKKKKKAEMSRIRACPSPILKWILL